MVLGHQIHGLCQMTAFVWGIAQELSDARALPERMTEFRPNESMLPGSPMFPCSLQSRDVQRVVSCISRAVALFICCGLLKATIFGLSLDFGCVTSKARLLLLGALHQWSSCCCCQWPGWLCFTRTCAACPGGSPWVPDSALLCAVRSDGAQAPRPSQRGAGAVQG